MDFIRYKNSSPCGDLVAMMAGLRQMWAHTGKKAVVYQRLDMAGVGYQGAVHSYLNEIGDEVCMNKYAYDMIKPLLLSQEYIEDYLVYSGENVDYDLDKLRMEVFTNQPHGSLNRYLFYVFPQMACDLSQKYIEVSDGGNISRYSNDRAIINFTHRYRNHMINYFFLKEYEQNLIFAGLPEEHGFFCKQWGLTIPLLDVKDFYQLAQAIQSAKCVLGNQSMVFQIAEGLKVPRILEIFPMIPNVIPVGKHAYDAYHQSAIEYYFNKLMNIHEAT